MSAGAAPTIGVDIGGTKLLGVLLDADGHVLREHRLPTRSSVDEIVAEVAALAAELDGADGRAALGVGAAGLVRLDGLLSYAPNLPTIVDAPLRELFAAATGRAVVVDNDANVAALGEVAYGAARGADDALMVTLGTGIGGGIVLGGRVVRGANGFAGEIGHITVMRGGPRCACGEFGHWESIASGSALGRMARSLVDAGRGAALVAAASGDPDAVDGHAVGRAAGDGDGEAQSLLAEFADNVALGLAALANILDPKVIVISGGLVSLGPLLFEPLTKAFESHIEGVDYRPAIPILPAELGERAGAIGAAIVARDLIQPTGKRRSWSRSD